MYVLSYDVTEDSRRAEIAKLLESHGQRVQKSVFEVRVDARRLARLVRRTSQLLDGATDSLRVYRICAACETKLRCHPPVDSKRNPESLIA